MPVPKRQQQKLKELQQRIKSIIKQTLDASGAALTEEIDDRVANFIVTGPGLSLAYDDPSNRLDLTLDADLEALAALSDTNTIYYRSAANTWSPVTIGTNLTFSAGTLAAAGGGSVSTEDNLHYVGGDIGLPFGAVDLKAFGAVGDGVTNDAAAIAAAHATGFPVSYGANSYFGDFASGYVNLYSGSTYKTASVDRAQYGLFGTPVDDPRPMLAHTKMSSASRAVDPAAWDQVGYFGLIKKSGSAFGAAVTGYARADGGSGDQIGGHFRGHGKHSAAEMFGAWVYVEADPPGGVGLITEAIGMEINLRNRGDSATFATAFGTYRGLAVLTQDSSNAGHIAVDVGMGNSAAEGWLYGIRLREDGIVPTADTDGPTAQILIEGGGTTADRFGMIQIGAGYFTSGLDFRLMAGDFTDDRAISLRPNHRIYWNETADATARYMVGTTALTLVNLPLITPASVTGAAGLNLPHGTAPSSPVNGATVQLDAAGGGTTFPDSTFQIYDNTDPTKIAVFDASSIATGTTRTYVWPNSSGNVIVSAGSQSFTGTKTFSVPPIMATPSTSQASMRLPHGAAPTTPTDGDVWTTTGGVFARVNGATVQLDGAGSAPSPILSWMI